MIEAYAIGVSLLLETNVPAAVQGMLGEFMKLDKALKDANAQVVGLNSNLRGMSAAAKGVIAAAEAMDKLAAAAGRARTATAGAAAGMADMGKGAAAAAASADTVAAGFERAAKGATAAAAQAASDAKETAGAAAAAERLAIGYERAASASKAIVPAPRLLTYDGSPGGALVPAPRQLTYEPSGLSTLTGGALAGPRSGGGAMLGAALFGGGMIGGAGGGGAGGGGGAAPYGNGVPRLPPPGGGGGIPLNFNPPQTAGASPWGPHAVVGAAAVAGLVDVLWKSTAGIAEIQSKMLQAGFTQEQVKKATDTGYDTQQKIPGVSLHDAMEIQLDIATLLRNPDEAAKMSPTMGALSVVLGQYGKTDQVKELFEAVQSGELRGSLINRDTGQLDPDLVGKFVKEVMATTVATGGRIDPHGILQFLQNAGVGGRVIGNDELFGSLIPAMLSMSTGKAGTGLQAFYSQFGAGKMSKSTAEVLGEMGLVKDWNKFHPIPVGLFRVDPGGLKGTEMVQSGDVMGFITKVLLPGIHDYDMKHYGKDNPSLQATTAKVITSRIPGGNFLADILSLLPLASSYQNAIKAAEGRDITKLAETTNPAIALDGMTQALSAFGNTLASGTMPLAMDALRGITTGLNALSNALRYLGGGLPQVAAPAFSPYPPSPFAPAPTVGPWAPGHGPNSLADPLLGWRDSAPTNAPTGPVPVTVTNPHDIGNSVGTGLSNSVSRPPTGPTNFDTRLGVMSPGLSVPGP